MNRILFFLEIIILNSCSAQQDSYSTNKINMYTKNYNSEFEKLDTSALNHLSSLSKENKEALPKQLTFSFKKKNIPIQRTGNMYYNYEERDTVDNNITLEINIDLRNSVVRAREKIDEFFYLSEDYYLNGNIRSKVINSWLGFAINVGYKYDSDGTIIETIDYDEGYEFSYKEVFEFCKKNNILLQLNKMNRLNKVTLENGRKVWNINYFNPETNKIDIYQLDGKTGEIILKELGKEKYGIKHY